MNGGNYMKKQNNIKCDVSSCNYNNCEEGTCKLKEVHISCNCDKDNCHDSLETVCQSFIETSSNITDNEYEVD